MDNFDAVALRNKEHNAQNWSTFVIFTMTHKESLKRKIIQWESSFKSSRISPSRVM